MLGGQHPLDLVGDRAGDVLRPDGEEELGDPHRQPLGPHEAGQRRHEDQEREQRHQRRQGDVAGHRPAVVPQEMAEGIANDHPRRADGSPRSACAMTVPCSCLSVWIAAPEALASRRIGPAG